MGRKSYSIGDVVVLKAGLTRVVTADRICAIVGILPSDHGEAQYRVRFDGETFERRIVATDIECIETVSAGQRTPIVGTGGPWLKSSGIRLRK